MSYLLGVGIDKNRIAWIFNSEKNIFKPTKLTTVSDNQRKAEIHIYLGKKDQKHLLYTETIENIPPMPAEEPSIDFIPEIRKHSLIYEIYLNGKYIKRNTISLRRYTGGSNRLLIVILLLLAVAALATAVFFLLIPQSRPAIQEALPETVEKPEEQPPATSVVTEEPIKEVSAVEEISAPPAEIVYTENMISDRASVFFLPDSAKLTDETIRGLEMFIDKLPSHDDYEEGSFKLEIKGHCARYGTEEGRAELSRERAVNVYNFLETEWGIEADSMITGVGSSEPATLERNQQHLNRRVDIEVKGKIKKIAE